MENNDKLLLLGDQAIALGAIHAGISGVYAYPGTPSTEITEYIQDSPLAKSRGLHSSWCTNEKTAMEAALGVSYVGKRALVCMKHVGMNVCADAFVNSGITGVNGGIVVLAADDPSMHSSQNEQDSRFYGKFAMIPILEPSSQQEAYDMMEYAYSLSEEERLPVLMRITTRMAHSRAAVKVKEKFLDVTCTGKESVPSDWVLLPGNARRRYLEVIAEQSRLLDLSETSPFNEAAFKEGMSEKGIVACGIGYNYVMENYPDGCPYPVIKISQYPLPADLLTRLAGSCREMLVVEDGQPFVEEQLKGLLPSQYVVKGRLSGDLPRTGELTPDNVKAALGIPGGQVYPKAQHVVPRPPALCVGCGHRDVYDALNRVAAEYPGAKILLYAGRSASFPGIEQLRGYGSVHHDGERSRRCRPVSFHCGYRGFHLYAFGHDRPVGCRERQGEHNGDYLGQSDNGYDGRAGFCRNQQVRSHLSGAGRRAGTCACGGSAA